MHKYRRLLGEVLIASFFLQLFELVTPLFFQVAPARDAADQLQRRSENPPID